MSVPGPVPKIILKPRREERILEGHLWVFSNEIARLEGSPEPGGPADVFSHRNAFLGRGFFNPKSLIAARILTRRDEAIDRTFISSRIRGAEAYRQTLFPGESDYRLVFGESDGLPGLVIDRYGGTFVLRSYALGMDRLAPLAVSALGDHFRVDCVVNKSDSSLRLFEGLKDDTGVLAGHLPESVSITQPCGKETLRFLVDVVRGQKSGFFFDQRENRQAVLPFCRGRKVLDAFAYSGGFGLAALKGGASEAVFVESSAPACAVLESNLRENRLSGAVVRGDVSEVLGGFHKEKRKFDIICLDPPALARSKKDLFGALRKYRKLNELALSVLDGRGILVSSSCSRHVSRQDLLREIGAAGAAAGRTLKVRETRGQCPDHPVLPSMPETDYLKCAVVLAE